MGIAKIVRSKKQMIRSLSFRGSLEASITTMVSEKKMIWQMDTVVTRYRA